MIILTSPAERTDIDIQGATFSVRRPGAADTGNISTQTAKYTESDVYAHSKAICKCCVVSWTGIGDADGNEIEYAPERIDELPLDILQELSVRIQQLSNDAAKKNNSKRKTKKAS